VLIHGAGGGVGHLAVQLAKTLGAEVTGTCSAAKAPWVLELGADRVIDYQAHDFAAELRDVDVVLDLIGGGYAQRSLDVLRDDGLLITAVERPNAELAEATRAAGKRFSAVAVDPDPTALRSLARLAAEKSIRVHVDGSFGLSDVAEAHRLVESGHARGKVTMQTESATFGS
jgi:NADPH:quinone reductase-like Zn-dependent oxidoreductase